MNDLLWQVENQKKAVMEENMTKIAKFLRDKNPDATLDNHFVLTSIFQFCLERRSDLRPFLLGSNEKPPDEPRSSPKVPFLYL